MTDMILMYIFCNTEVEAESVGGELLKKRLCPCYNILPNTHSAALWPPKTGKIEKTNGSVLLIKTLEKQYGAIEKEVIKLHSDSNPCIFALSVNNVSKKYYDWLKGEIV